MARSLKRDSMPARRRLSMRGGSGGDASEQCKSGGSDGDEQQHAVAAQPTPEELMGKMVGAMVTVNLKIGPKLCGRLASIDAQMNMMLEKPVEQWVNGTLAAVDDCDMFVRCHNVIDFGVLRGSTDPTTLKILSEIGVRPREGLDHSPVGSGMQ